MGLDQSGQSQAFGQGKQVLEPGIIQGGNNQEDHVSPVGPGLPDLIIGDDEVLVEDGDAHGLPDLTEVIQGPQESPAFSQDRYGRGPSVGILTGKGGGILDIGKIPLGGGSTLDFRNDRDAGALLEEAGDVQRSTLHPPDLLLELLQGNLPYPGPGILHGTGHQFVQDSHRALPSNILCFTCTTLASFCTRLPLHARNIRLTKAAFDSRQGSSRLEA